MEIVWKTIPGWEGLYRVSSNGDIYSCYTHRVIAPAKHLSRGDITYRLRDRAGKTHSILLRPLLAQIFPELYPPIGDTRLIKEPCKLTVAGVTRTISEWADLTGIPKKNIYNRVHVSGWRPEQAVSIPLKKDKRRKKQDDHH